MKLFIGTGSATYAQKASRVLNGLNIRSKIVKRQTETSGGCGYGVELNDADADNITSLLREAGVKITAVRREDK